MHIPDKGLHILLDRTGNIEKTPLTAKDVHIKINSYTYQKTANTVFLSVLHTNQRDNYRISQTPRHAKRLLTKVVWPRPLQGITSLFPL